MCTQIVLEEKPGDITRFCVKVFGCVVEVFGCECIVVSVRDNNALPSDTSTMIR